MALSRLEKLGLSTLLLIFSLFTWRGVTMFFSGDDMMNMYGAWNMNPWVITKAQLLLWMPVYRPVGAAVYRLFYELFRFHPGPLYTFCWLLLAINVVAAYYLFREVTGKVAVALIALALVLVHGSFGDLYYSAGTIYDRLCFFFTVTGLIAYFQYRRQATWQRFVLVCLLSILAMGSKESGVALPLLMFCCEWIYFRAWTRQLGWLFAVLAALSAIFILGRVNHTPELAQSSAYHPDIGGSVWLTHLGEYFRLLTFRRTPISAMAAGAVLGSMAAAAVWARNRAMIFGWLFFVISITPVALITARLGYVLYLPILGLGMFFAAALCLLVSPLKRAVPRVEAIAFVLVTLAMTWVNARHWQPAFQTQLSPEFRLTEQFRRTYPKFPANTKLLFVTDEFPKTAWDLMFNVRLLYHDKSILVNRLEGLPDQLPSQKYPVVYDHLFATEAGHYVELDPRTPEESIRLNILRDYTLANEMDMGREDHSAYVVSGLKDGGGTDKYRWTAPNAKFKFVLRTPPSVFTAKMFVPDFVAKPRNRVLSVLLNGNKIGEVTLTKDGMNEISFPVPAGLAASSGYTFVEMNVSNPYKDDKGVEFGVVLIRAGFATNPVST